MRARWWCTDAGSAARQEAVRDGGEHGERVAVSVGLTFVEVARVGAHGVGDMRHTDDPTTTSLCVRVECEGTPTRFPTTPTSRRPELDDPQCRVKTRPTRTSSGTAGKEYRVRREAATRQPVMVTGGRWWVRQLPLRVRSNRVTNHTASLRAQHRYQWALVALRTFLGVVYLSNGLAKLFDLHVVSVGPWTTYLINRHDALGIQKANTNSSPGFLHDLGTFVINNWGVFQWLLTAGELAVGIGLLIGVLSRASTGVGLLLALAPFVFTLGAHTWTYDYLFEPVTLGILATVPSLPGVDSYIRRRRPSVADRQPSAESQPTIGSSAPSA